MLKATVMWVSLGQHSTITMVIRSQRDFMNDLWLCCPVSSQWSSCRTMLGFQRIPMFWSRTSVPTSRGSHSWVIQTYYHPHQYHYWDQNHFAKSQLQNYNVYPFRLAQPRSCRGPCSCWVLTRTAASSHRLCELFRLCWSCLSVFLWNYFTKYWMLFFCTSQQKQQQGNQLAKDTDKLMKVFTSLPIGPDQVQSLL